MQMEPQKSPGFTTKYEVLSIDLFEWTLNLFRLEDNNYLLSSKINKFI